MGFLIDAWLESGIPQVRIRDADTGVVRLRWDHANFLQAADEEEVQRVANRSLQCLFKDLVLLACASNLALAEGVRSTGFSDKCVGCGACVTDSRSAAPNNVVYLASAHPTPAWSAENPAPAGRHD